MIARTVEPKAPPAPLVAGTRLPAAVIARCADTATTHGFSTISHRPQSGGTT